MTNLLNEHNAAGYLGGMSIRTLQRWRLEGTGPTFTKMGRLVRYNRSDLDVFIEASRRTSTSEVAHVQF